LMIVGNIMDRELRAIFLLFPTGIILVLIFFIVYLLVFL
jgi:hypothetical protein